MKSILEKNGWGIGYFAIEKNSSHEKDLLVLTRFDWSANNNDPTSPITAVSLDIYKSGEHFYGNSQSTTKMPLLSFLEKYRHPTKQELRSYGIIQNSVDFILED